MIRVKEPQTVTEIRAARRAVTKPVTKPKGGRPKRYETAAERQAAYRARKKTND